MKVFHNTPSSEKSITSAAVNDTMSINNGGIQFLIAQSEIQCKKINGQRTYCGGGSEANVSVSLRLQPGGSTETGAVFLV